MALKLLLSLIALTASQAFVVLPKSVGTTRPCNTATERQAASNANSRSKCRMLADATCLDPFLSHSTQIFSFLEEPQLDSSMFASHPPATALPTSIVNVQSAPQALTPDVEAEVLTDVSHLVMDFSSFFTPSILMIRILSVLGRILVISADYLPDHVIRPEELSIQIFLLLVSMYDILKTITLPQQRDSEGES